MNFLGIDTLKKRIYRENTAANYVTNLGTASATNIFIAPSRLGQIIIIDWFRFQLSKNSVVAVAGSYTYNFNFLTAANSFLHTEVYLPAVLGVNPELTPDKDVFMSFPNGYYNGVAQGVNDSLAFVTPVALTSGLARITAGYHYEELR